MKKFILLSAIISAFVILAGVRAYADDQDGDGIDDVLDNCPGTVSTDIRDSDNDGLGNVCDPSPFASGVVSGGINGNDDKGPLACHMFTLRIPPPTGDTLPPGSDIYYWFSIFDTGNTFVLLNPDTISYLHVDEPGVPEALDIRTWGLQAILEPSLGAPLDLPEAEVAAVVPRAGTDSSMPDLLGGPVTNEVLAYIDYTINVQRGPYSTGTLECPATTFFEEGDSPMPAPLYWVDLEPFGSTSPSPYDGATSGQRYYVRGMRFINGANSVESPQAPTAIEAGSRFLYDTGNTTTQINESMAAALGIDLTADPDDTITVGGELLSCYIIDRVEIDAGDNSYRYIINNALVCVKPAPAFGGAADANIGSNFFETSQVLFDGPGSRLGLFTGAVINAAPVCDADGPYTAECQGATTYASVDGTGSGDPDPGDTLTYAWTSSCPGGSFDDSGSAAPMLSVDSSSGSTVVCDASLTVTDSHGASDSCSSTVTVLDTLPPSITCPADITIECDQSTDPSVTGTASASDVCDASPAVTYSDTVIPGTCPAEKTVTRTWTATDASGNTASCAQTIEIVDTTAPVIESLTVSPDVLWPPNHKLIPITASVTASDNCDGSPTASLELITMNEGDETSTFDPLYDTTAGDGHTNDDIQVDASGNISLRAERSGTGNGRIYTITYSVTDCSGNTSTANTTVTVPHNQ